MYDPYSVVATMGLQWGINKNSPIAQNIAVLLTVWHYDVSDKAYAQEKWWLNWKKYKISFYPIKFIKEIIRWNKLNKINKRKQVKKFYWYSYNHQSKLSVFVNCIRRVCYFNL